MDLYKLNKSKLEEVRNIPFKLERDIQLLVEENIQVLFGLEFVKSEFILNGLRIDTLCFDQQSKSFVIIEYKKSKSYSVIDQGYSYLSLLLNNKADFILEYLERTNQSLKKNDVDWSQSRVIFISPQFTTYQKQSIEFKDLPFELWEIKKYSNETIVLNQHKSTSQESVNTISSKDERAEQVSKEIVVYTEEDHISKGSDQIKELYLTVKEKILEIDDFEIKPMKLWINFKKDKKQVLDIEVKKNSLKMHSNLKSGELDDPKGMFRDVTNIGHWGTGDYQTSFYPGDDIDYLMSIIKQTDQIQSKQLLNKVIRSLQKLDINLTGIENANTWDDICIQVQSEFSFYWPQYPDAIEGFISLELEKLAYHEKMSIWYQTELGQKIIENEIFNLEEKEGLKDLEEPFYCESETIRYLSGEIWKAAGNWSNKRIRDYIE